MPLEIPLTRGCVALIDAADLPLVKQYRWSLSVKQDRYYARGTRPGQRGVGMHNLILGHDPARRLPDHRDGDGLNNQRYNLRWATRAQNSTNSVKRRKCASIFKGVSKRGAQWQAQFSGDAIGTFETETDAALAYDAAARVRFGEFARLNFPKVGEQSALPTPLPPELSLSYRQFVELQEAKWAFRNRDPRVIGSEARAALGNAALAYFDLHHGGAA